VQISSKASFSNEIMTSVLIGSQYHRENTVINLVDAVPSVSFSRNQYEPTSGCTRKMKLVLGKGIEIF
jgi:hypothetical protein